MSCWRYITGFRFKRDIAAIACRRPNIGRAATIYTHVNESVACRSVAFGDERNSRRAVEVMVTPPKTIS